MTTKKTFSLLSLLQESNGKWCSKRIVGFVCLIMACVLPFRGDAGVEMILAFLGGALASNGLTIWDFKNK